jgi:hypothetical protein
MEAARAQSLQRAMMTSAWIYPTRSCGSRRLGATGGGSSSRRSQTELQWRPIVGSGRARTNKIDWARAAARDGSEHVDAMFKLDRIHNLLIRR